MKTIPNIVYFYLISCKLNIYGVLKFIKMYIWLFKYTNIEEFFVLLNKSDFATSTDYQLKVVL